MASKYRLTVNLSESEYHEMVTIAKANKVSMAWLGRKAIELLLRQKTHGLQLSMLDLQITKDEK